MENIVGLRMVYSTDVSIATSVQTNRDGRGGSKKSLVRTIPWRQFYWTKVFWRTYAKGSCLSIQACCNNSDVCKCGKCLLCNNRLNILIYFTGTIEVFHSVLLKYCQKQLHFHYSSMFARTQLTIMDHNENVQCKQATTTAGKWKGNTTTNDSHNRWTLIMKCEHKCMFADSLC